MNTSDKRGPLQVARRARLLALCVAAEAASGRSDWENASRELTDLKARFDDVGPRAGASKVVAPRQVSPAPAARGSAAGDAGRSANPAYVIFFTPF